MKIKNIKINNYGNLKSKEINLENKINIIYGKNETGKSTLLNYIKNIFYGISKNKNGKEISDYEKYKPWYEKEFSGKIKYELDNGENFEIFRDFNKKNPKVFNGNLEDISENFKIDKKDGVQILYEQTNIDENMFLSTVVSEQQEVRLVKQQQSILVQKIANLAGSGDDRYSLKKVQDMLNKKQIEEIGTERTQGRPINVVKEKMKNIELVIKDIEKYKYEKESIVETKRKLMEKNEEEQLENNVLKNLNRVNNEIKIEKEKIKLKENLKNDLMEKIGKIDIEKKELLNNKKIKEIKNIKEKNENNFLENKNKIKYIILLFVFIIIFLFIKILNTKILKNNIINILNYFIIPIYLIFIFIKINIEKNKMINKKHEEELKEKIEYEQNKNEINIIDTKIENLEKQEKELLKEKEKEEKEIDILNIKIDNRIDNEIEKIKNENNNIINIDNLLDKINFDNLENTLNEKQEELNKNEINLQKIKTEEKIILEKLENLISLQEEYKLLEEKLEELEEKNMYINLTKEYLNKAYEKMKNNVTPKFTENLSKCIAEILNNKYNKVTINENSGLIVENEFRRIFTSR